MSSELAQQRVNSDLDSALLSAHAAGDKPALVSLYQQAAEQAEDENAAGFYLVQAYVFALDCGHEDTARLKARLIALRREE